MERKVRRSKINKLLAVCLIVLFLGLVLFYMPLPYISTLWEIGILRGNMVGSVSQRVEGLHLEEVTLILGESEREAPEWLLSPRQPEAWLYRVGGGRYFVVFFDSDGIVVRTQTGNPMHF